MSDEVPEVTPGPAGTKEAHRAGEASPAPGASGGSGAGGAPAAGRPAAPGGAGGSGATVPRAAERVRRSVVVDAGVHEVWGAVANPAERALWLDDPDASSRHVRIDETTPQERLTWTWWRPGDEDGASTVSVELIPAAGGGTRVVVTETAPPTLRGTGGTTASALAGGGPGGRVTAARRAPAWPRCAADRWDGRLLGLELRFVAARALVA